MYWLETDVEFHFPDRGDDDWSPWQRQNQQRRQESLEAEFWSAVAEAQLEEEEEVTRPQLQPRSYGTKI